MASSTLPISQSQAFCARARLIPASLSGPVRFALPHRHRRDASFRKPLRTMVVTATTAEMPKKRQASRDRSFVDEMRTVAMKLHTKDQAKEGEKESKSPPVAKWEPSIEGYLRFLVDSKIVYDTLETIIQKAAYPWYAEFRSTGLERSEKLAEDLKWFKDQGHTIPKPSSPGVSYAQYLEELSQKDPQAFICHFYNIYFAHSAGGRMIGKKKTEARQSHSPSAIVIGGGFAGIAAAHALKNATFQVVLLESRDRIGGRVHTNYSFDFPVDMGAAWLHGVCNENPLASWIGRLGLPIYRTSGDNSILYDHDLESYALFDGDGHQVPQDLVEKVGKVFETILEEVEFEGLGELRSKDEEDEGLGELRSKDEEDEGI